MVLLLDILSGWNVPGRSTDASGAGCPGGPLEGRDQGEITLFDPWRRQMGSDLTAAPPGCRIHSWANPRVASLPHTSQSVGNERSDFVSVFLIAIIKSVLFHFYSLSLSTEVCISNNKFISLVLVQSFYSGY